jgi:DNA invertase Pin-like site-specific DNA recombinase
MAEHHSTNGAQRAALYYRMSTDRQEDSIERQQSQVEPYAKRRGYSVVGEYRDEGIAGDVFERRTDFQRLLRDAGSGKFDVIVTDEPSRLSRQGIVEFIAKVAHPLQEAGVTLDSVSDGPQGWDDVVQIITLAIRQDRSSDEPRKLSRRVLTDGAMAAKKGQHLGGSIPYGYRMTYAEPGHKPCGLVIDPDKAKVVVWIFEKYDGGFMTIEQITAELNVRCVVPPGRQDRTARRTAWMRQTVRYILRNPKYTGCLVWNRSRRGKYYRLEQGRAVAKGRGKPGVMNDESDWEIAQQTHEAIISRELFDRVGERLARNRNARRSASRRGYVFSGMLVCGFCGRGLTGCRRYGREIYRCLATDDTGAKVCGTPQVRQEAVLRAVAGALQRELLNPDNLSRLREELRRQEEAEKAPSAIADLEKRLKQLDRQIAQGNHNLTLVPPDFVQGVLEAIAELRRERGQVEAKLKAVRTESRVADLEAVIAEAERMVWRIREAMGEADPSHVRAVLDEWVHHIEVRWTKRKAGGRYRYECTGGTIFLRPDSHPPESLAGQTSSVG